MLKKIKGDVTWKVTFDATAKMAGAKDCSYTRHYDGTEDESARWLCPTCDVTLKADVTMPMGEMDCYAQLSMTPYSKTEWLGWAKDQWQRGAGGPMTAQGTITNMNGKIALTNHVDMVMPPMGGMASFDISGSLDVADAMGDPLHGFVAPAKYACGWPKADPPKYTGDYVLKKGAVVPDGILTDACSEPVRFHDFKGDWLVIEMSARDCPPCQAMASGEEKFVTDMAAQGIKVHVLTLLAPSLADPLGDTTLPMLKTWISTYKLKSPVLEDRGWGISEFEPAIGAMSLGYPSWVIVDPNLKVIDFMSGFGTWDDFKTEILANK